MMIEIIVSVISSLISGLCVAIPSVIATVHQGKKNNELIEYRINELTKKVEKHNQVVERVYKLEQQNAVEEEEIEFINRRVNDLEKEA